MVLLMSHTTFQEAFIYVTRCSSLKVGWKIGFGQKLDERLPCKTFVYCKTIVSHTTFNLDEYVSVNILITVIV